MKPEIVIAITIFLAVSLEWILIAIERYREKKYHREYMRDWRKKRRIRELRQLRQELKKFRGKTIRVNDWRGGAYEIKR